MSTRRPASTQHYPTHSYSRATRRAPLHLAPQVDSFFTVLSSLSAIFRFPTPRCTAPLASAVRSVPVKRYTSLNDAGIGPDGATFNHALSAITESAESDAETARTALSGPADLDVSDDDGLNGFSEDEGEEARAWPFEFDAQKSLVCYFVAPTETLEECNSQAGWASSGSAHAFLESDAPPGSPHTVPILTGGAT